MNGLPKLEDAGSARRRRQGWSFLGIAVLVAATTAWSVATALQRGAPLPQIRSGLLGMWSFRSSTGTQAVDASGAANGSIRSPSWVDGRGYLALRFDGETTVVEIPAASAAGPDGSLTVGCWIRPESTRDRQVLLVAHDGSSSEDLRVASVAVYVPWGRGRVGLVLYDGERRVGFLSGDSIQRNRWQHVAVSLNGRTGRLRFYLDGELESERQTTVIPRAAHETRPVLLGAESAAVPPRFGLQADVESVALYDRELTVSEVAALARGAP